MAQPTATEAVSIWRLVGFILRLHRSEVYGDLRVHFEAGVPKGILIVEATHRLDDQAPVTAADVDALHPGVESS